MGSMSTSAGTWRGQRSRTRLHEVKRPGEPQAKKSHGFLLPSANGEWGFPILLPQRLLAKPGDHLALSGTVPVGDTYLCIPGLPGPHHRS